MVQWKFGCDINGGSLAIFRALVVAVVVVVVFVEIYQIPMGCYFFSGKKNGEKWQKLGEHKNEKRVREWGNIRMKIKQKNGGI